MHYSLNSIAQGSHQIGEEMMRRYAESSASEDRDDLGAAAAPSSPSRERGATRDLKDPFRGVVMPLDKSTFGA